jgi:hypothetical protein
MELPEYALDGPTLAGVGLKLHRAKEQLDEIHAEILAWVDAEPYVVSDETETDGEWYVTRMAEVRVYPDPRWGVRAGEFFHDLRSALDNLVWQLVLLEGREEPGDHNQFPIYTRVPSAPRRRELKGVTGASRIHDMLFGVSEDNIAEIHIRQPYLGLHGFHRDHRVALRTLSIVNNIDKHKVLHPAIGVSDWERAKIRRFEGDVPPERLDFRVNGGPIYPGAELMRFRVRGEEVADADVEMETEVPFEVAFGDPVSTLPNLNWLRERIFEIVDGFAAAFPSGPDELHGHDSGPPRA